ncbi:uncharacterized protein LOC107740566 [Sinocyclocheilus rhinocerous]|uniref:uncharacterized protein LOC107740566 n=1 Tax=Sinocyclocheilus rhinocerous TaxID=307959 RepID=UPI0007B7F822|nr:PREDICTED: uncharacterized protein LOC107740566 [Sinocyclocheilus rhinocerous]
MSHYEEREEADIVHYQNQSAASPEPSCVSIKSDVSINLPPYLSDGSVTIDPSDTEKKRSESPEPSCVSIKSDLSINLPPYLSDGSVTFNPSDTEKKRSESPEPSCVSIKSNLSINLPPYLSDGAVTFNPRYDQTGDPQQDSHHPVDYELQRIKDQHKTSMKNKYESLFEGINLHQTLLNRIYTQLYIIEGERQRVNEEHEVFQMEKTARKQHSQDIPIYCNDIFKASPEPGVEDKDRIKTVLTKGMAGIGKTVSVQKFILDWAEGKANQDVDFMFVLPFRELNLIKDHQYSLHKLLLDFHPELQDLDSKIYEECRAVFIFDGLDESRITLMFSDAQKVSDVTDTSSVGVLISNLMKGKLLPSALIWITSRPAAANQIPSKYINRLTEIQGFNEPQKEEYFRKRISDQHQASRIISHIRRARSLHIMCSSLSMADGSTSMCANRGTYQDFYIPLPCPLLSLSPSLLNCGTVGNYTSFEYHAITITNPAKLQLVVIYRPPGQLGNFLEELEVLLSSFLEDGTLLVVMVLLVPGGKPVGRSGGKPTGGSCGKPAGRSCGTRSSVG